MTLRWLLHLHRNHRTYICKIWTKSKCFKSPLYSPSTLIKAFVPFFVFSQIHHRRTLFGLNGSWHIFSPFFADHAPLWEVKKESLVFGSWGAFKMASFSVPCPKCPSTSFSSLGFKSQLVPFQSGFSFKPFLSFSSLSAESASSRIQVSVFTSIYVSISASLTVLMFCSIDFSCKWRNDAFINDLRMRNYVITRKYLFFGYFAQLLYFSDSDSDVMVPSSMIFLKFSKCSWKNEHIGYSVEHKWSKLRQ